MSSTVHIGEIRPSEDEAREMESLALLAFTDVPIHRMMFPLGEETREEERRWRSQRFRSSVKNPAKRFVVAVEETGVADDPGTRRSEIIGWAQWTTAVQPEREKTEEETEKRWAEKMAGWPDVMNKEAYRRILEGFDEVQRQWLDGDDPRDYWILDVLAVHPGHQRKGVGARLTRWGIQEAAKEGKGVGLISRPTAKRLYSSLGFRTFEPERIVGGDTQTAMRFDKPVPSGGPRTQ